MKYRVITAKTVGLLIACFVSVAAYAAPRPNIIYILANDLGYGDVHCLTRTREKLRRRSRT